MSHRFQRVLIGVLLGVLAAELVTLSRLSKRIPASAAAPATAARLRPLHVGFEANRGQADAWVRFLSRAPGHTLLLTRDGALLTLQSPRARAGLPLSEVVRRYGATLGPRIARKLGISIASASPDRGGPTASQVRVRLLSANPRARIRGVERQRARAGYYLGRDPSRWVRDIPTYQQVRYDGIYPGIDLVYHDPNALEYDFVVRPGADPRRIAFAVEGAAAKLDRDGNLVLHTACGDVVEHRPHVYQPTTGGRRAVEGSFSLAQDASAGPAGVRVAFNVGDYDRARPLVIDPQVTVNFATFLGGAGSDNKETDWATGVTADSSGNSYFCGFTADAATDTFPGTPLPQDGARASQDIWAAKFDPAGGLLWSVLIGGNDVDSPGGIGVDKDGNVYLDGTTFSSNFPVTETLQKNLSSPSGAGVGFVMKLTPAGALTWSFELSGSNGGALFNAIAVDPDGNSFIAGAAGPGFPTTAGTVQPQVLGGSFATNPVLAKVKPDGSALEWATYVAGGTGSDERARAVALDGSGNVIIGGQTDAPDVKMVNAFQAKYGGNGDGLIAKVSPDGTQYLYTSYYGGSGEDFLDAVSANAAGTNAPLDAVFGGQTLSDDLPVLNAVSGQSTLQNDADGYFGVTLANGALAGSSYWGGHGGKTGGNFTNMTGVSLDGTSIELVGATFVGDIFPGQPPGETYVDAIDASPLISAGSPAAREPTGPMVLEAKRCTAIGGSVFANFTFYNSDTKGGVGFWFAATGNCSNPPPVSSNAAQPTCTGDQNAYCTHLETTPCTPPAEPTVTEATFATSFTKIFVKWKPGLGGGPVDHWQIVYKLNGGGGGVLEDLIPAEDTSWPGVPLPPGDPAHFAVAVVAVSASCGSVSSAPFQVNDPYGPVNVTGVSASRNPVTGGKPDKGTAQGDKKANKPQKATVTAMPKGKAPERSAPPTVQVPKTVTFAKGKSTAKFRITTRPVTAAETWTITVSINGSTASTDLTVNPKQ